LGKLNPKARVMAQNQTREPFHDGAVIDQRLVALSAPTNQPSLVWIDDPTSIRASLDDRTMSDTDAPAMSAPEPVAAPAPAPAAPVFDNAKVDELKLQATDKVQELYKKGKDKLDQVKNCQPLRSRASRPIPRVKMPSSSLTTSPPRPLLAVRPLRRQPQG